MAKLKWAEVSARIIVWIGVFIYTAVTVLDTTKTITSIISIVFLWIFVVAIYITGLLDLIRFAKENKRRAC